MLRPLTVDLRQSKLTSDLINTFNNLNVKLKLAELQVDRTEQQLEIRCVVIRCLGEIKP